MNVNQSDNNKKIRKFLRSHQWLIILGLFAICFVLGYIGFRKYFKSLGSDYSSTDLIYLVLQLATLESGALSGSIGWELEVARFLTPLVAAYTAVTALAVLFRKQLDLLRLRMLHEHIIVCGLGEKGWHLVCQLQQEGFNIAVIEIDPSNPRIERCRELGIIVLERDARILENLKIASGKKAAHLVAVCGNDPTNAEIAIAARELSVERQHGVLHCIIHIKNPILSDLLRDLELGFEAYPTFRLEIFNIFERGAHFLISKYVNPFLENHQQSNSPQFLIVGCGSLGEHLILQLAQRGYETRKKTGTSLALTVIDPYAQATINRLGAMYPLLTEGCQLNPLNLDVDDLALHADDFLVNQSGICAYRVIFICLEDTHVGLQAALSLRQRLDCDQPAIILYMPEHSGLASLFMDHQQPSASVYNIMPFRLVQSIFTADLVINGVHEILARTIHQNYFNQRLTEGVQMGQKRSMATWEDLPEDLRHSNRRQVDHIRQKLHAIGYGIKPIHDWDAVNFQFSDEEVEKMAKIEHDRWMEERLRGGWRFGYGPEDPKNKTHPDLVTWEQLAEEIKDKDRQPVRALPKLLASAGLQVFRWKGY